MCNINSFFYVVELIVNHDPFGYLKYSYADEYLHTRENFRSLAFNSSSMIENMRRKRDITERQTFERYTTRRRKCRVLRGRACRAQSRSDEASPDLGSSSENEEPSKLLLDTSFEEESNFASN